jgi:hypothetical protein
MHKKQILLLILTLIIFALVGCKADEPVSDLPLNQDLVNLMPKEGFKWAYHGPSEYYHEMVLESITEDASQATYKIVGEVRDVSSGEDSRDHSIQVFYQINGDSIIQMKTAEAMLDSEYDQLTIIKTPLETGTTWVDEITDKNGKKQTIQGEIIEITEAEDGNVYKVVYTNKKQKYSESRKIKEGYGILAFTKAVEIDGEKFSYGYGLYGKESGYGKNIDGDVAVDDQEDPVTDETDTDTPTSDEDTDESVDDSQDEATDENTDESNDESEDEVDAATEEIKVKDTIEAFNAAWIRYVNEDDQSFFDYVTTNGVAYKNAKNFNKEGLTEEFLKMNITQVIVNGNTATAKVYEEIKKTKDGDVSVAKYNWLYDLVKKDGQWFVNGYQKQ